MIAKPSAASLVLLVLWAVLCAAWNAYGVAALARGGQALGPTATISGTVLVLVLVAALIIFNYKVTSTT